VQIPRVGLPSLPEHILLGRQSLPGPQQGSDISVPLGTSSVYTRSSSAIVPSGYFCTRAWVKANRRRRNIGD
jgi:hypothetical protein